MKSRFLAGMLTLGLALAPAAAAGQMWFFPDYAIPSASGAPATWVAGTYGRGLNDDSGKTDAYGLVIGRTGDKVSFLGGVGQGRQGGEGELTLGGAVGLDVMQGESTTVSVQGGLGWFSSEIGTETLTALRFPIGVAVKGMFQTSEASIAPWIMPRVNIARLSGGGDSQTNTDLGASGGVSFTFPGGFGVHTALDFLLADEREPITFGMGAHYLIGGGGN